MTKSTGLLPRLRDQRIESEPPWTADGSDASANHELAKKAPRSKQAITIYDPHHPAVLFHQLANVISRKVTSTSMFVAITKYFRKPENVESPKHPRERIVGKENGRCLLDSGLILPNQRDVFAFSRPHAGEEYLIKHTRDDTRRHLAQELSGR